MSIEEAELLGVTHTKEYTTAHAATKTEVTSLAKRFAERGGYTVVRIDDMTATDGLWLVRLASPKSKSRGE